jgi:excinuclease ABC subunit C
LLERFGSIERIQQATLEELTSLKGITPELAQTIKTQLE